MGNKSFTNSEIKSVLDGDMDDVKVLYEEIIDVDALHEAVNTYYDDVSTYINDAKEKISYVEEEFGKEHIKDSERFKTSSLAVTKHNNINDISAKLNFNDILKLTPISDDPDSIISMAKQFNTNLVEAKHKVRSKLINQARNEINDAAILAEPERSETITTSVPKQDYSIIRGPIKITITYTLNYIDKDIQYNSEYNYTKKEVKTYYCSFRAYENAYENAENMIKLIESKSGRKFLGYNSDDIVDYDG